MAWDKGEPHEGILAPDLNDVLRDNNDALEAALDAWIRFETGGTQSGQPRQGSARPYFQDSAPTARLDGEYFDSTDLGAIWIDTNADPDNQANILTAADGAGTETWTPITTEIIAVLLASARVFADTLGVTGNLAVNTDKFTVAAATGNTAIAGTLGVTGIATVGDGSKNATSAAPDADAELANKKYVDDQNTADHPAYTGGESHTDGSGLIIKMGKTDTPTGNVLDGDIGVGFAVAFPNAVVSLSVTAKNTQGPAIACNVHTISINGFQIRYTESNSGTQNADGLYWIAIGY